MRRCAAALLCALALAAPARAAPAPCVTEVELSPPTARVGEQVLYRLRVLRSAEVQAVEWDVAPRFPGFRSEWLPGRSAGAHEAGLPYLVVEERRALFAVREGRLEIPPARLRCLLRAGESGASASPVSVEVPARSISISAPPAQGRPADWTGLVGRVSVRVEAEAERVALGEALRVRVLLASAGNLWEAAAPFPDIADTGTWQGVEVFAHAPELQLDAGQRLHARRLFVYDLVPRRAGDLVLPAVRVPYFDAETQRYAVAEADPVRLRVDERSAGAPPGAAAQGTRREAAPRDSALPRLLEGALAWTLLRALLALGLAMALVWGWRWRSRAAWRRQALLRELESSSAAPDPETAAAAVARALRAVLAREAPAAAQQPADALATNTSVPARLRALAADLAALERARFDPAAPRPDLRALRERLGAYLRRRG